MDSARRRESSESLLRELARDPDYTTNPLLRAYLDRIDRTLLTCGADGDDCARIRTFCGMMGEMLGHLWSAILGAQYDAGMFEDCLTRVGHHCALAMSEQSGVPFYSAASVCFADRLMEIEIPSASESICLSIRQFSGRFVEPFFGGELEGSFRLWTERATARYLYLLNHVSDSDAAGLMSTLAACYAANAHIMAIAIEMWLQLQVTRDRG